MQVFPTVEGIEVFVNEGGTVTVKQESFMGEDPSLIVIPLCHVSALCKALRITAKEAKTGVEERG